MNLPKIRGMRLRALTMGVLFLSSLLSARAALWSTAYYAGWMHGYLPASAIDYTYT